MWKKRLLKVGRLRMGFAIPVASVVVAATVLAVVVLAKPGENLIPVVTATHTLQPTMQPTDSPPTATQNPTATETPLPTLTVTPSFSIYGTWVADGSTTLPLINIPPAGQFCEINAGYWYSEFSIQETENPSVARVYGLHEHVAYRDVPLDLATMSLVDTFHMPDIGQTLIIIMRLEQDGRMYYEEQYLIGESIYCSGSVYYLFKGE